MCSPNPALCLVWKIAEVRPGVPRFSLPTPRHSRGLAVTFPSASAGFDQLLREKVTLTFPAREEVHPGNTAFWGSSRSTLTLCAERRTASNLLSVVTTSRLPYPRREVLQPTSAVVV